MAPKIVKKLLGFAFESEEDRQEKLRQDLLRHEAKVGGTLFGNVPNGGRRDFFCLDEHTWVWHEEWRDENGHEKTRTTKYSIRPKSIVKSQNDGHYQKVSDQEALCLLDAARAYQTRVNSEIYSAIV